MALGGGSPEGNWPIPNPAVEVLLLPPATVLKIPVIGSPGAVTSALITANAAVVKEDIPARTAPTINAEGLDVSILPLSPNLRRAPSNPQKRNVTTGSSARNKNPGFMLTRFSCRAARESPAA